MLNAGDGLNSSQFSQHGLAAQEFSAPEGEGNLTALEGAVTGTVVGEVSTISDAGGFKSAGPGALEVSNCCII